MSRWAISRGATGMACREACTNVRGILLAPAPHKHWMDVQHIATAEAGKDYPRTWNEFLDWFGTEQACLAYLERLRGPQEFVCPACGVSQAPYRSSRTRLTCRACGRQSTVTAGTIFDKTRTPLRV